MQVVGGILIFYLLLVIISALLMVYGIKEGVRGWLLPWLITWFIVCMFQLVFGLWLLGGYYIYVSLHSLFLAREMNLSSDKQQALNHIATFAIFAPQLDSVFATLCNWLWMSYNVSILAHVSRRYRQYFRSPP